MRVLVAESDPATRSYLMEVLVDAGLRFYCAESAEEALEFSRTYHYDLITTEHLGGRDYLPSLCSGKAPVIVVSDMDSTAALLGAFSSGAADYVTKPFHREELVARVFAVARRAAGHAQSVIRVEDLSVDLQSQTARFGTVEMKLTNKEYQLLELFALRRSSHVSRKEVMDALYAGFKEPEERVVDVFVYRLRKKLLEASGGRSFLQTRHGLGWVLS